MRYIDIDDDEMRVETPQTRSQRNARLAQAAAAAKAAPTPAVQPTASAPTQATDVQNLESQVRELMAIVERFQKIPQVTLSTHAGAEHGLSLELSPTYQKLTAQGVNGNLAASILRKAEREIEPESLKRSALVDAWVVRHLLNTVEVSANPTGGRYHAFIGTAGQGKTSTLIKMASHLLLKQKRRIAIICLDTVKLGAPDQLRLFAQILNVPFAIVRNPDEWAVAEQRLVDVQNILVDAPGFSLHSSEEVDWLKRMLPPAEFGRTLHFVQSILGRDEESQELANRYQAIGFNDIIFTRLDEASRFGTIINFQERFKTPLHSFATGSRIPEDLELASKERVVDLLFKLSRSIRKEETV
jgi:flagellar biosynthesis protein FlhF